MKMWLEIEYCFQRVCIFLLNTISLWLFGENVVRSRILFSEEFGLFRHRINSVTIFFDISIEIFLEVEQRLSKCMQSFSWKKIMRDRLDFRWEYVRSRAYFLFNSLHCLFTEEMYLWCFDENVGRSRAQFWNTLHWILTGLLTYLWKLSTTSSVTVGVYEELTCYYPQLEISPGVVTVSGMYVDNVKKGGLVTPVHQLN